MLGKTFCNSEMVSKIEYIHKEGPQKVLTRAHPHHVLFYASSRNASSRKQTQPLQGKGALKLESHFQQYNHC